MKLTEQQKKEIKSKFMKDSADRETDALSWSELLNDNADWWLQKIETILEDKNKEIIERIEAIKYAVRKQTGSFKYDSCYDECIDIIKLNNK